MMNQKQTMDFLAQAGVPLDKTISSIGEKLREWEKNTGSTGVPRSITQNIARMELDRIVDDLQDKSADDTPCLNDRQLEQQDFVEGVIHESLEQLAGRELEHDISLIAPVRDVIAEEFARRGIMTGMEFYPYIDQDDEPLALIEELHDTTEMPAQQEGVAND